MDREFCNKVVTIPQTGGTCWFTAILMSLLYSQHSRKLLYNHFEQFKETDSLSGIFDKILKSHYVNPRKAKEFFLKFSSESILDYIRYMDGVTIDPYLLSIMKINGAYPYVFLPKFIRRLNKSCLTLDYYGDTFFTGINEYVDHGIRDGKMTLVNSLEAGVIQTEAFLSIIKDAVISNPDYICINIWNYNTANTPKPYYAQFLDRGINTPQITDGIRLHHYPVEFSGLYEFQDEITYNGERYVLNSCILGNYNQLPTNHAIAGIVCKNGKYVYNGWIDTTIDPAMVAMGMARNELPCFLTPYPWDVNNHYERFCLNHAACSIERIQGTRRDLCFSFGKGLRVVLYVKKSSIRSIDHNDSSSLKSKKRSHSSSLVEQKSDKSSSAHLHDLYKTVSVVNPNRDSPQLISPFDKPRPQHIHDMYKTPEKVSNGSRLPSYKSSSIEEQMDKPIQDPRLLTQSSRRSSSKDGSAYSSFSKDSKYFSSDSQKTDESLYVSPPNRRPKLLINRNKEEIEDRINELLDHNKGLLLTNKKIKEQIKELKLKIKLL